MHGGGGRAAITMGGKYRGPGGRSTWNHSDAQEVGERGGCRCRCSARGDRTAARCTTFRDGYSAAVVQKQACRWPSPAGAARPTACSYRPSRRPLLTGVAPKPSTRQASPGAPCTRGRRGCQRSRQHCRWQRAACRRRAPCRRGRRRGRSWRARGSRATHEQRQRQRPGRQRRWQAPQTAPAPRCAAPAPALAPPRSACGSCGYPLPHQQSARRCCRRCRARTRCRWRPAGPRHRPHEPLHGEQRRARRWRAPASALHAACARQSLSQSPSQRLKQRRSEGTRRRRAGRPWRGGRQSGRASPQSPSLRLQQRRRETRSEPLGGGWSGTMQAMQHHRRRRRQGRRV